MSNTYTCTYEEILTDENDIKAKLDGYSDIDKMAEKIYSQFQKKIDCEYESNSISKEERARLELEYLSITFQTASQYSIGMVNAYIDSVDKFKRLKYLLPKEIAKLENECKLIAAQIELTDAQKDKVIEEKNKIIEDKNKVIEEKKLVKQQIEVAFSQAKLYAQQRKSFINRDKLNIIDEYVKTWIAALSEGADIYPIIATELRGKIDEIYGNIYEEMDTDGCEIECVSVTKTN